jgi:hypothetical protein
MALRAAPAAPVSIAVLRERKADRRSEADELRMEVRAAGQEMVAMANRIHNALIADDIRSADHYTNRLAFLGHRYAQPEGGPDVA